MFNVLKEEKNWKEPHFISFDCCSAVHLLLQVIEGFSQYKDLGQVREVAEKA